MMEDNAANTFTEQTRQWPGEPPKPSDCAVWDFDNGPGTPARLFLCYDLAGNVTDWEHCHTLSLVNRPGIEAYADRRVREFAERVKGLRKYDFTEGIQDPLGKRLYDEQDNLRERLAEDIDALLAGKETNG